MTTPVFVVDPAVMLGAEFTCCVPCAVAPAPVVADLDDWAQVEVRPVFEVRCDAHGVVGYAAVRGEAKVLRDRHWHEAHATRDGAAT